MKSWLSRIALGLAAGAVAVTVPLTATNAFADDSPYGDGWHQVGAEQFDSWKDCYDQMQSSLAYLTQYHEATCTFTDVPNVYGEWMR